MALIYSDTEPKQNVRIDLNKINPNNPYKKHLANWYYLRFIERQGTTIEKIQAGKELTICERKLLFWYRQPTFSKEQAGRDIKELQTTWKIDTAPAHPTRAVHSRTS